MSAPSTAIAAQLEAIAKLVSLFRSGWWSKWQRTANTMHGDASPTQATVPSNNRPWPAEVHLASARNGHLEWVHNARTLPIDVFRIQHGSTSPRLTQLNLALTKNPHTWLRNDTSIFPETEGFMFAIQDDVIPKLSCQKCIMKNLNVVTDACRLCGSTSEIWDCLWSKTSSKYKHRHNQVARDFYQVLGGSVSASWGAIFSIF